MAELRKLKKLPKPAWYTLTFVVFFLSIFGIITLCIIYSLANYLIYSYGIIIDAGSTSTKIFLYKWPEIASRTNGEVSEVYKCKKRSPAISDFVNDPENSMTEIKECIDNEITPKIPKRLRKNTFIYLGATAGMRLIEFRNQKALKLIYENIGNYLLQTGYKIKKLSEDVKTISGTDEGISAWISVNYLNGVLQKGILNLLTKNAQTETVGALDLGGASTQITFVPKTGENTSHVVPVRLYGTNYNVYSYSYLCYGKSQAELRFMSLLVEKAIQDGSFPKKSAINNPCMLKGDSYSIFLQEIYTIPCVTGDYAKKNFFYTANLPENLKNMNINITFIGIGDPNECQPLIEKLFEVNTCPYASCGFNRVYQPKPINKFLAFSGFHLIYELLLDNTTTSLSYDEFLNKTKTYCKRDPPVELNGNSIDNRHRKWRCFGFFYVFQLLTSFGFNRGNWNSITFLNSISDASLGWSLGYMINKTALIPVEKPVITLSLGAFCAILLSCLVLLSVGCLLAIISLKLHRLKKHTSQPSENVKLKSNLKDNNFDDITNEA